MIQRIITFSVRNKFIVGLFTLAMVVAGIWSLTKVPIDAVPDITNNQVQVLTQAPNLGTREIEQFVTFPIETAMANLPGVVEIRSISRFGLSAVTIVFEEDMGTYLPRQLVGEKLNQVKDEIPPDFGEPFMGPISTGLGEIYQYTLEIDSAFANTYSPTELRTIQDWIIRRQMAMVPGVVEVNSFGGYIKQYEVAVSPDRLKSMNVTLTEIYDALAANNSATGGAYIEKDHMANYIRGEGLATSLEDLRSTVVSHHRGIPVTIDDVAEVRYGHMVRYGALTKNGKGEAVGGMIMMLKGANSNDVISAVKERIEKIQKSLPKGVQIKPFLDRSALIGRTTSTVTTNLIEGALIVIFVLVFLLGNWRGGLIVASTIPLSLLFAFILMHVFDVWANLMSLGAIDFGIIVDGAVIIVEGTVFVLHDKLLKGKTIDKSERDETAIKASGKMMNAAFFGQLIILIVFIPILALEGVEGKMFRPMALTFMFAMIGVMILCLTYVPMMSAWFLRVRKTEKPSWGDRIVEKLENGYERVLQPALNRGAWIVGSAILFLALAVFAFTRMGGEFIPQLDEGDIAFHTILRPGSSLSEAISATTKVEKTLLANFPEIDEVICRIGVSDVPTDLMPMDAADCFIILKPEDEWVSAESKEELIELIKAELEVLPGLAFEFTQPIEMRFNELMTGVREDVAIKVFGEDLDLLAEKAAEISALISDIEGIGDMRVEATTGLPQITINYQREKLAQYGLQINEINQLVATAFAGGTAGVIFEGEKRFDLVVRLQKSDRQSIQDVRDLFVTLPSGTQLPLGEVAEIAYQTGPMQISRDNTNRRTYVGVNVRGRDIQSLVEEIQTKLDAELDLPPGYYLRYGGTFENFERATKRLRLLVPVALAMIFVLIYFALGSIKETAMIYIAIPLAAIGGVFSLWLRDMPFSISAGVGFIVLFGVAVLNGLVLISAWSELKEEGITDLDELITQGARRRIRPILLTALTDILGFLPMALSTSAGAEVQQPLATVVIGGMISATLLTLFVLPVLYRWLEKSKGSSLSGKGVATLSVLLALGVSASAQTTQDPQPLSMEAAVSQCLEGYPQLQAARLEVKNREALKKTSLNLGQTGIFTAGEEMTDGEGVVTIIGFQQQNIDLFGIPSQSKLRREEIALAESELDLTRQEVAFRVKQAYAELYASMKRAELYRRLDSLFSEFERAAKVRYETEATSKLAYLAAANQAKQITINYQQSQRDRQVALARFNRWFVGDTLYTASADWEIEGLEPTLSDSLGSHPLLRRAESQLSVADQSIDAANAQLLPQLNLQYGIQEIQGQSGFVTYQAGINLPLLFFNPQGRIQSAKIGREIAEQNLIQTQMELKSEYLSALENYFKWKESWEFYRDEAFPLAEEQLEGASLSYREGAIDYVAFLQNAGDAIRLEIDGWTAFTNYANALFQLDYYTSK
jgi:cobalt-zinc-cadmium resistance protein CzcA